MTKYLKYPTVFFKVNNITKIIREGRDLRIYYSYEKDCPMKLTFVNTDTCLQEYKNICDIITGEAVLIQRDNDCSHFQYG